MMLLELALLCATAFAMEIPLEGQQVVDYLNEKQSLFTAELPQMSDEVFQSRLMDLKYFEYERKYANEIPYNGEIPESFDARKQWPHCKSVHLVRDQANCGSCWAVSGASAMSDRACVQSQGKFNALLSDADLLSCCVSCGYGCEGGSIAEAWMYAKNYGLCTGGPYGEKNVCKPYPFHPCGYHKGKPYYGECEKPNEDTPVCKETCEAGYSKQYKDDKIYARTEYDVAPYEAAIQKEIMLNGPVQAGFIVYQDFSYYKKGIYKHTWGKQRGGHAIKIIGWGVENGVKYWTIANSWNSDWGEDGHFRILRGTNECSLESWVTAGMMRV